jgi:hypothetical protein
MGFSGRFGRSLCRGVFWLGVLALQLRSPAIAADNGAEIVVAARRSSEPRAVQAVDSISGWMDRFGIATGWNKETKPWFREGRFRNLRSEMTLSRDLMDLVDQDGTRVVLMPPNLPVKSGEEARAMFEKWKLDTRAWLLSPASKVVKGDGRVLMDFLDSVEGLNERDRVTCQGMITGKWPCPGWPANFIDSAVALQQVVEEIGKPLRIIGPSLVTPVGGKQVRNAFERKRYLNRDLSLKSMATLADAGNFHFYGEPRFLQYDLISNGLFVYPGLALEMTEWGYFSYKGRPFGADWANMILDAIEESRKLHVSRIFLYGLLEREASPVNALVWKDYQGSYHPTGAYHVLSNLNRALRYARDAASGEREVLSFTLSRGGPRSLLLQSGPMGKFHVLVWGDSSDRPELVLPDANFRVSYRELENPEAEEVVILPRIVGKNSRYAVPPSSSRYPVLFTIERLER